MKNTPDSFYLQLLENQKYDRTRVRWTSRNTYLPTKISTDYSPVRNPKSHQTLKMTFRGRFIKAQLITKNKQPTTKTARRGTIRDFSPQSRGRLFDLFNQLEIGKRATFITLTYPTIYVDAKTAKSHLRAFIKRINRKYSYYEVTGVWRMEFQERGAIHFHLVLFKLPFIHKETIAALWAQVTHTYSPFTRIEGIDSPNKLINYVSKYVGKVNPESFNGFNSLTYLSAYQATHGEQIGRSWGYLNKKELPYAEETVLELAYDYARFMRFRRTAEQKFPPMKDYISPGFKLYVASAEVWLRWFHEDYDIIL